MTGRNFCGRKAHGASVVIDLYSAWFKSVGVFRNIRSPRDVALETEQAAEKQVWSPAKPELRNIVASSTMEHRHGQTMQQGKTKSWWSFLKLGTCWFWCGHRMGTLWVCGVWAARFNCDFSITMGWNLIGDANQQLNLRHILNFDVWWTNNIRFAARISVYII